MFLVKKKSKEGHLGRLKMIGKKNPRLKTEREECFLGKAQMNGLSVCWTEKIF